MPCLNFGQKLLMQSGSESWIRICNLQHLPDFPASNKNTNINWAYRWPEEQINFTSWEDTAQLQKY